MFGGGVHGTELHLARHLSIGQERVFHVAPQAHETIPGTTTGIGNSGVRYEAARRREADKCHDDGEFGTNRHCGGGLGVPIDV